MAAAFAPSEQVVLRYLWCGRVFGAVGATVVEDGDARTALWVAPGTPYHRPDRQLSMAEIAANDWSPVERPWDGNGTLMLSRPGEPYSTWLFWDQSGEHASWYVNLERPRRRTALGFDSRDHMLDLVVRPDRSWRWKDEDDLRDAVVVGLLTEGEAGEIRAAGEAVIAALDELVPTGFERWRPDPAWPTPRLPAGWDDP